MPDDPSVVSAQHGQRFVPCYSLVCRTCRAAVVHVDHLAHQLGRGAAWVWPFDASDAVVLAAPDLAATVARLVAQRPRWTARQVAPPRFATPPLFAMFLEGWKHGDLDSQCFERSFADAGSLVAAMRARAPSLPAPDSIAYVLAPGLLTSAGYRAFVDHLP